MSSSSARSSLSSLLAVVAAGVLWGTGGLSGALLGRLAHLDPLAVATYRLAGGGLTLLVVLSGTGRLVGLAGTGLPGLRRVLAVGLLAALYQGCYFAAVGLTNVAVATPIALGAAPVLVLGVEAWSGRRRPSGESLAAIGLAVLGLVLLVGLPGSGTGGVRLYAGVLLALVTAAGFAALTLLGRRPVAGLDISSTVGLGFAVGAVPLAATSAFTGGLGFAPSAAALGVLGYLAVVPTALAYALYFAGLRGVAASSASVVALLEPVTAAVLAVTLLGEHLGPAEAVGAALLCLAALVANLGPARLRPHGLDHR